MDPFSALLFVSPPIEISPESVIARGPIAPLAVPTALYPVSQQADWLLADPRVSMADKVRIALSGGMEPVAWHLVDQVPGSLLEDPALSRVLRAWVTEQIETRQLPGQSHHDLMVVSKQTLSGAERGQIEAGLLDAQALLGMLPGPRWLGPVVVVTPEADTHLLAGTQTQASRPALPVLRLANTPTADLDTRAEVAKRTAQLSLALQRPPAAGWPDWLVAGVGEVAALRALGRGPSPRRMLRIRQAAGEQAITAMWSGGQTFDPQLATAVAAALLHRLREKRLSALLDALRAGAPFAEALQTSYGLTPAALVTSP